MTKENYKFDATNDFEKIEIEEKETLSRRVQTYTVEALKTGLAVDKIFVQHTRFKEGLAAMDRIFQISKQVSMPHGLRVVGPTGVGKSALFHYFKSSLPTSSLFAPDLGCLRLRVGARPTTGQIISTLLEEYKYPFNSVSEKTIYRKKGQALELVRLKGTRLIFIDEAQNLMRQVKRRGKDQVEPEATVFLCELMDATNVALVLGGTDELDKLGDVDSHLADRISGRVPLVCFEANGEWLAFLNAFVKACNWFDLKLVQDHKQAKLLHLATGGSPRNLKRLLTEAVLVAAQSNFNSIQVEHFAQAYSAVYGEQSLRTNPYA
jgi:Bacterial TniB protein